MDNVSLKASTNWICNEDISSKIQTKAADDFIENPDVNDLVSEGEHAFIVSKPQNNVNDAESCNTCEMQIALFPKYKVAAFHVVCSASKLEVFLGHEKEYMETEHGILVENNVNGTEEQAANGGDAAAALNSYRFDVEIQKSGIYNLTLKFLACHDELCIFGIMLQIGPNPNGITTLMPTAINLENVQQILDGAKNKSTPGLEKYKVFMEAYGRGLEKKRLAAEISQSSNKSEDLNALKEHINAKFEEMESKLLRRIDEAQKENNEKLETVLKLLEAKLH